MKTIKELRKEKGLTQVEAAKLTNIPLRTFKSYENDESKAGSIKYNYIIQELTQYGYVDEEHGVLSLDTIKSLSKGVMEKYDVEYAILFGSYAREEANEKSDIDILISTEEKGLQFYAIVEELRTELKKRVDLLDINQVKNNPELLNEILKYGVRIYG